MFGVIGIPVTQMASAAQAAGIRFLSCRNEQAAGYAAAAAGFLTGKPGVLLTVSGPGMVHGMAGLSHAKVNGWPMIMISGSCETGEVGKGAFQELDQCQAASPYVKLAIRAKNPSKIAECIHQAYSASMVGGFGPAYVDVPSDVFMAREGIAADALTSSLPPSQSTHPKASIIKIVNEILAAECPLVVLGVGTATERAEVSVRKMIDALRVPFITSSMARGVVPDSSEYCANAARSLALSKADVVIVLGSPLNWQLHFGEPPKWSDQARFVLIDNKISRRDKSLARRFLEGPIGLATEALTEVLGRSTLPKESWKAWRDKLGAKARLSKDKMELKLAKTVHPLNYQTTLRVIRDAINAVHPSPIVVSEGANTMDQARILLEPVNDPRCRIDAGAWGTMGIGPGCAIAAAVTTDRSVVAVEGDSAFGFSGMEVETICRYNLPIVVILFNNGGIYGGDRRAADVKEAAEAGLSAAGWTADPAPTAFVPNARYDMLSVAFGGDGYTVETAQALESTLKAALKSRRPTLINVTIDPQAGVESGTVHSFNFTKPK
jgi:2-hydroxyacyl-CoA lyase 1